MRFLFPQNGGNKKLFIIIFLYTVYKTYLEISRESKVKESIMLDIKIKNISDEKDKIIEQKDKIIQNKDTEIEKLKKQLEELQQKYDKIKSMFN